jgi:hypothetical protein
MIEIGKIVARSKGTSTRGPYETIPWEIMPYSQHDLQTAVNGFDNLILGMECLLENPLLRTKDDEENQAKLLVLVAAEFDVSRPQKNLVLCIKRYWTLPRYRKAKTQTSLKP